MKYYRINLRPRKDPDFCFLDNVPVGTEKFSYRFSEGDAVASRYPADARIYMDSRNRGLKMPDLVGNTRAMLLVSKRVKEVIAAVVTSPAEYLPCVICDHKKRVAASDYFIINPLGTFDLLDLKASEIERDEDGDVVGVDTFVLDGKRMSSAPHLFRVPEAPREYLISQILALEFKKRKFTNLYLYEVPLKT